MFYISFSFRLLTLGRLDYELEAKECAAILMFTIRSLCEKIVISVWKRLKYFNPLDILFVILSMDRKIYIELFVRLINAMNNLVQLINIALSVHFFSCFILFIIYLSSIVS